MHETSIKPMNNLGTSGWWKGCPSTLRKWVALALLFLGILNAAHGAQGLKQFDVFLGFDHTVMEGNWFPVICEVANDGPTFTGVLQLEPSQISQGQTRRYVVELPTGTQKRFVVPVFASSRYNLSWNARLYDQTGRKRAEQMNVSPRRTIPQEAVLMGALARRVDGVPIFPEVHRNRADWQPVATRIQPELFPDNPLTLDALKALYLNSEKALDLKAPQVNALLAWLGNGGHLIVAIEQPGDLLGTPWLRDLLGFECTGVATVEDKPALHDWLRLGGESLTGISDASARLNTPGTGAKTGGFLSLRTDNTFEKAPLQIATGVRRFGRVVASAGEHPLILSGPRGRGLVTVLTFSPEREPLRAWQNKREFWARLLDISPVWLAAQDRPNYGTRSLDGVFGAMVDSKQVRKLPVGWLVALLLVYLAVIGPVDHYVLKRLNRQMLTWITFPAYVILFSGLIYFIGYKLRAGDNEWNEIQVLDLFPNQATTAIRGRSFGSLYSPANATYGLAMRQNFASLRGDYAGSYGGGQESGKATVNQQDNAFSAEAFVPVWTSQLFIGEWWHSFKGQPLVVTATRQGGGCELKVANNLSHPVDRLTVVVDGWLTELGTVPARGNATFTVRARSGRPLRDFVKQSGANFNSALDRRHQALGGNSGELLPNHAEHAMAACFSGLMPKENYWIFRGTQGFDLTPAVERGEIVLLAWCQRHTLAGTMNQFTPRRSQADTLYRLTLPAPN
jgi:hypothetical protein